MYASEERKRILSLVAGMVMLLFETAAYAYVWIFCYDSPFYNRGNYVVILLYGVFVYMITKVLSGYRISYMRLSDLLVNNIIAVIISGVIGYIFVCMVWSMRWKVYGSPIPIVWMCIAQMAFVVVWILTVRCLYRRFYPPRKMIIVYGNYPLEAFLKKINTRADKYEICEILNYQKGMEKIQSHVLDFEGVVLYDLPVEERNGILKYCYEHSIRTYVVPKISDIIMGEADEIYLVDTPLFMSRNQGLHIDQRIIKRIVDVVFSLLGIIVFSPIMLVTALSIKLYDKGPVLYRQIRLTRARREFTIFKFRSMYMDAEEKGVQLAKKYDHRITPVGRVIRRLHIDELPQLFNVLKGDMSLVGPRPERPEIFEKYSEHIPEFDFRLKVKAGITGYAQVYGKYNTTPIDKLKLDLLYIQKYSIWLDFKLMLMTLRIIFSKDSSEGVEVGQTTALKKEGK